MSRIGTITQAQIVGRRIAELREQQSLSRPQLVAALNQWLRKTNPQIKVTYSQLSKWETGERRPTRQYWNALVGCLCASDSEAIKSEAEVTFRGELEQSRLEVREPAPKLSATFLEDGLRILPLQYPRVLAHVIDTVEGKNELAFIPAFLTKMFAMAGIHTDTHPAYRSVPSNEVLQSRDDQIELLKTNESDLLVSLSTLYQIKTLRSILAPLHLSLNAVLLEDDLDQIEEAKDYLTNDRPIQTTFHVMAVTGDMGLEFLQTRNIWRPGQSEALNPASPSKLAERVFQRKTRRPLLVVDELSGLAVVKALRVAGIQGCLVLPITTAETVATTQERRSVAAHYVSLSVLRNGNWALYEVLLDSVSRFLSHEPETVATLILTQYKCLVHEVKSCLESNYHLYLGGARRIPSSEYKGRDDFEIQSLREQQARAYARFALKTGRDTISQLPIEFASWAPIVRRAHQKILIEDSRNRRHIREVVLFSLATALERDPTELLPLLRDADLYEVLSEQKLFINFRYTLSRELDIDFQSSELESADEFESFLRSSKPSGQRNQGRYIEAFVTFTQNMMEKSEHIRNIVEAKTPFSKGSLQQDRGRQREVIVKLRDKASKRMAVASYQSSTSAETSDVCLAYCMGEPVGMIEARSEDLPSSDKGRHGRVKGLRLITLFVEDHMSLTGATRQLVRKSIEIATLRPPTRYVWCNAQEFPDNVRKQLIGYGFYEERNGLLIYELHATEPAVSKKSIHLNSKLTRTKKTSRTS